jgi:hypothetical protein
MLGLQDQDSGAADETSNFTGFFELCGPYGPAFSDSMFWNGPGFVKHYLQISVCR